MQSAVMPQYIVCLSIHPSVTFMYRDHIGLEFFKNNFTVRADPNMGDLVQREHPQNCGGIGVGSLGSGKKPAISPKRCKI